MIEIYDDFVPDELLKKLSWELTYIVPYYLSSDKERGEGKETWALGTARNKKFFNEAEHTLLSLIEQKGYDTSQIYRNFINCFRKADRTRYHKDPGCRAFLIYLNYEWKRHWGAPTKFKSKLYHPSRRIYPKPGRLVVYPTSLWHKGTAPSILTPNNIPGRLSMAFHESSYQNR